MFKNLKFILAAAIAGLLLFSCAKEREESNASVQKRILEAYLEVNYPDKNYTITNSGLVILSHEKGTGASPEEFGAAYMKYSAKHWLAIIKAQCLRMLQEYGEHTAQQTIMVLNCQHWVMVRLLRV